MTCNACGDAPKKKDNSFTKAVVEINNPETLILFRKVVVPTSMGDEEAVPPAIGKYYNVLLVYEANNNAYLYSSDGIPTRLTSDVAEDLAEKINTVAGDLATETHDRQLADEGLQSQINLKANSADLSTVATSGNYNDLTNKPTIGNATLTIKRNSTTLDTFTANATSNKTVDVSVPESPSDIGAQPLIDSDNKLDADLVDDTSSTHKFVTASDLSAIGTALQPAAIDKVVVTDLDLDANTSTTTVQLDAAKENLLSGTTTVKNIALPVASTTEAGVMNSATYDAVTSNTNNINALLNGAVAITGISASPSQADLTTAWQTETGLTTLINRASIYDVTNQKVWTYYTNDTTWHEASNTAQVTVNQATNSSLGTVKGSTNTGQAFVENDGTLSVNGWDTLNNTVTTATSKLSTIATGAEVNVQADWTEANSASDAYIQNKPTIPTVNNATLTIKRNNTSVGTFTANASSNKSIDITVPTKTSELTNDGADNTSTYVEADELATVATSGSYVDLTNKPTIPTVNNATLTIQQNGTNVATFTANSSTDTTANITSPNITMTDTDPGEGSPLSAGDFIGVYGADPIILDYSTSEVDTGAKWIDGSPIYKKTVNFGALPNATYKEVAHNISNLARTIKVEGWAWRSDVQWTYPISFASPSSSAYCIGCVITPTTIRVETGSDRTGLTESYFTIYYTKSS